MSRLPFTIAPQASPAVSAFDAWLERAAMLAVVAMLLAAGAGVGFIVGIWLFN